MIYLIEYEVQNYKNAGADLLISQSKPAEYQSKMETVNIIIECSKCSRHSKDKQV